MRALQRQHIVDIFVWVDDSLPKQVKRGQKPALRDSELLTILIWDGLNEPHKTLSSLYTWIARGSRGQACNREKFCEMGPTGL